MPLIVIWIIYATTVIYVKWFSGWDDYPFKQQLVILIFIILFFAVLITISCSVLLDFIQQDETGKPLNLWKSLLETLTKNIIHIVVLSLIWSIIWFILTILEIIFSKKDEDSEDEELNAENVAKFLSGYDEDISFWSLTFEALKKGVRMVTFLIMPAFAWENLGIFESYKRGISILRHRIKNFISAFVISICVDFIIFLPVGILFYITGKLKLDIPDWLWVSSIIYIGLAWSFSIYVTAELYMWHLKWEREVRKTSAEGKPIPKLEEVEPPSILDGIPDLIDINKKV